MSAQAVTANCHCCHLGLARQRGLRSYSGAPRFCPWLFLLPFGLVQTEMYLLRFIISKEKDFLRHGQQLHPHQAPLSLKNVRAENGDTVTLLSSLVSRQTSETQRWHKTCLSVSWLRIWASNEFGWPWGPWFWSPLSLENEKKKG